MSKTRKCRKHWDFAVFYFIVIKRKRGKRIGYFVQFEGVRNKKHLKFEHSYDKIIPYVYQYIYIRRQQAEKCLVPVHRAPKNIFRLYKF